MGRGLRAGGPCRRGWRTASLGAVGAGRRTPGLSALGSGRRRPFRVGLFRGVTRAGPSRARHAVVPAGRPPPAYRRRVQEWALVARDRRVGQGVRTAGRRAVGEARGGPGAALRPHETHVNPMPQRNRDERRRPSLRVADRSGRDDAHAVMRFSGALRRHDARQAAEAGIALLRFAAVLVFQRSSGAPRKCACGRRDRDRRPARRRGVPGGAFRRRGQRRRRWACAGRRAVVGAG